ncbi:MAG TPA: cyclase family protein [Acidimicrobiales bacterium]|nr:cyclase family protein [Acidimicrobiales bacterium]
MSAHDSFIREFIATKSNWGRWGANDDLGTLNLIDEDACRRGARAVTRGQRLSCARTLSPRYSDDNPNPVLHHMTHSGEGCPSEGMSSAADWFGVAFHGYAVTHIDAPSHLFWDGVMYNGRPASSVRTATGAQMGSVEAASAGIVTRAVLFDLPRVLGVEYLEPGVAVDPDVLDRAEREAGVQVESGDALLVRTGRDARRAAKGSMDLATAGFGGLSGPCVEWIGRRGVAVLGSDAVSDAVPEGGGDVVLPVHAAGIVGLGLWLIDNLQLEELAAEVAGDGDPTCQLAVAPLRIKNGTGSPVNPIAVR